MRGQSDRLSLGNIARVLFIVVQVQRNKPFGAGLAKKKIKNA
jgi:hypothetical protein